MENEISNLQIEKKIFVIRDVQVMVDRDIAELYGVETKRLNEQVKRNIERFPEEFMFQLTRDEMDSWILQNAISNSSRSQIATLNYTTKMHDRFMIIDNKILYHIGASLKDLGKKCFAFEILDSSIIPVILKDI